MKIPKIKNFILIAGVTMVTLLSVIAIHIEPKDFGQKQEIVYPTKESLAIFIIDDYEEIDSITR